MTAWVSKYSEPWASALVEIKQRLECVMEKVFEIYIRTTPDRLWEAITDPEIRAKYDFGVGVHSEWSAGSRLEMRSPRVEAVLGESEVIEADRPRRLVHTLTSCGVMTSAPKDRRSRSAPRRRQPPDLWRLADDPLRPEDLARDRRAAHDPGSQMYS
jgi:Activator of Hsp90 ATPase homolog 1-like protein